MLKPCKIPTPTSPKRVCLPGAFLVGLQSEPIIVRILVVLHILKAENEVIEGQLGPRAVPLSSNEKCVITFSHSTFTQRFWHKRSWRQSYTAKQGTYPEQRLEWLGPTQFSRYKRLDDITWVLFSLLSVSPQPTTSFTEYSLPREPHTVLVLPSTHMLMLSKSFMFNLDLFSELKTPVSNCIPKFLPSCHK